MQLQNPAALLIFVPAAAAITTLYMLRLRRRDVRVSSILLWRQVVRDVRPNAPFQKLSTSVLYWLQMTIAAAAALAVSQPVLSREVLGGRRLLLIVDTSAGMGARDVPGNRLQQALKEAHRTVDELRPGDQALVIEAGQRPQVRCGLTADRRRLHRTLSRLQVSASPCRLSEALVLAQSLSGGSGASQAQVYSDFAAPPLSESGWNGLSVVYHPVGVRSRNVGITLVEVRRDDGTVRLEITLRNADTTAHAVPMDVISGSTLLDARVVQLAPRSTVAEEVPLLGIVAPTPVIVSLAVEDDLEADNRAYVVAEPGTPRRVLVVSEANPFLLSAVASDPLFVVETVRPGAVAPNRHWDAVVVDGSRRGTRLPAAPTLWLAETGPGSPVSAMSDAVPGEVMEVVASHPVTASADLGGMRFAKLRQGVLNPSAEAVAYGSEGVAAAASEVQGVRSVWLGFRGMPEEGGTALSPVFPIVISSALRWMTNGDVRVAGTVETGRPHRLYGRGLQLMSREREAALQRTETGGFLTVVQPGFVRLQQGTAAFTVGASLLSEEETDTAPGLPPPHTGMVPAEGMPVQMVQPLMPVVVLFLVLVMGAEWWLFHRRPSLVR